VAVNVVAPTDAENLNLLSWTKENRGFDERTSGMLELPLVFSFQNYFQRAAIGCNKISTKHSCFLEPLLDGFGESLSTEQPGRTI
jgi:hypothetical protein